MKFAKIMAASFVALAMFSCSKEMLNTDQELSVEPGAARVVVNISGGTTSYATAAEEQRINTLAYAIYGPGGDKLATIDNMAGQHTPGNTGRVDLTIPADLYAALADQYVTLAVIANGGVSTPNMPANITALNDTTIFQSLNDISTSGMVASSRSLVKLVKDTPVINLNSTLRRGVSRFWVRAGGQNPSRDRIIGAVVTIEGVSEGVKPFINNAPVAGTPQTYTYTIGATAPADQFNNQETAFYTYQTPSDLAKITVALGGVTKEVIVRKAILANTNYSITITPKVINDIIVVDNVQVEGWVDDAGDIEFDFEGTTVSVPDNAVLPVGFSPAFGALSINIHEQAVGSTIMTTGVELSLREVLGSTIFDAEGGTFKFTANPITRANTETLVISNDGQIKAEIVGDKIKFYVLPNYDEDDTYVITLANADDSNEYALKIVSKGLPRGITVPFNGYEVMALPVLNDTGIKSVIRTIDTLNKIYPTGTINEKIIRYASDPTRSDFWAFFMTQSTAQFNVDQIKDPNNLIAKCPKGFRLLRDKAEFDSFFKYTEATTQTPVTLVAGGPAITLGFGSQITLKFTQLNSQYEGTYKLTNDSNPAETLLFLGTPSNMLHIGNGNRPADRIMFRLDTYQVQTNSALNTLRCVKDAPVPFS